MAKKSNSKASKQESTKRTVSKAATKSVYSKTEATTSSNVVKKTSTTLKLPAVIPFFKSVGKKISTFFKKFSQSKFGKVLMSRTVVISIIWLAIFFVSLVALDYLYQYLNNTYSIAVVNGTRITRDEYYNELEKSYGSMVTEEMISRALVQQEATRQDVKPDEAGIEEILTQYDSYVGGREELEKLLAQQNSSVEDFRDAIKLELLAKDMISLTVKDEDVQNFFEQEKANLYPDQEVTFEEKKDEVKEAYMNTNYMTLKQDFLTSLKEQAVIQDNSKTEVEYGFLKATRSSLKSLLNSFSQ